MAKRKGVYARDIDKLNLIFAIVAVGCLLSVVWMIWDDYAREWKRYQRRFQVIEQEVTQQQLADQQNSIDQQRLSQLTQQRDAAEQALADQQSEIDALEARQTDVQTRLDLATQNFRFARSIFEGARYRYEEAAQHGDASRDALDAAEARVAELQTELDGLNGELDQVVADLEQRRGSLDAANAGITAMTREINRLTTRLDGLRFGFVWAVRNAPMLDAFNPSLRIRQAVLPDLKLDLNFTSTPAVDRCQSCHLGITSDLYSAYSQPFTSHPRLDLFVADTSSHPVGTFGCTTCHLGKGRATSFLSAVHTPANESEEERWVDEHGWAPNEFWEWPMRPAEETEASCLKCHIGDTWMPDASKLEHGLTLIENVGCFGCHQLDRFDDTRKVGPSLEHIGVKTTPEWAYNWVMNPKSFRPNAPMPKFFNLANTSDSYWTERNKVEADAIIAYVFNSSSDVELDTAPPGDADRGREVVDSIGCLGCHIVDEPGSPSYPTDQPRFTGYRQQGPNLWGIGSKVSADWLYTWVRDPKHYWADTVMPNLRLTDRQAADVTAFLMSLTKEGWENPSIPAIDTNLRDEVVLEYLRNNQTSADAQAQLATMGDQERRLYLGSQLIGRYGCFGCHVIPGFETRGRIGTTLSDWGSKPVSRIDFGYLDIPHERRAFVHQKLTSPRSVDTGKVKMPQEKARMPNFQFTPEEIDAIATAILGYTDDDIPDNMKPAQTPRKVALEAGRRIVEQYNCRGCHIIEGRGGAIREPLVSLGVAAGMTEQTAGGYAPPNLNTEGAKTQPQWLYEFLHAPTPIRLWLNVHMPTFGFNDEQLNALTAYFSALDNAAYPFDEKFTVAHEYPRELVDVGRRLASVEVLGCLRCHIQGGRTPTMVPEESWGPDLALAAQRLRFEWILQWLASPQQIFPGTKMPQYWLDLDAPAQGPLRDVLGGDAHRQVEALASWIMSGAR